MVHTNHRDLINSELFPGALLGARPGGRDGVGRRPGLAELQSRGRGPALRVLAAALWRGAGGRATVPSTRDDLGFRTAGSPRCDLGESGLSWLCRRIFHRV